MEFALLPDDPSFEFASSGFMSTFVLGLLVDRLPTSAPPKSLLGPAEIPNGLERYEQTSSLRMLISLGGW